MMGYSPDSFYNSKNLTIARWRDSAARDSRSKPNVRNRIAEEIEKALVELAIEEPAWGRFG